jgi:stage II sporulation protein GA (sporulation sigma-E factor processing peptidase)
MTSVTVFLGGEKMYAEVMITLNALINYCLLSFTNKMGSFQQKKWRLWVSALTGGTLIVLFGGGFVSIVITFIIMIAIAFGIRRSNWILAASNCLIGSLFAGGLLTVIQPLVSSANWFTLLAIGGVVLLASLSGVYKNWFTINMKAVKESYISQVTLQLFSKDVTLSCFTDTGNQCIEALSGKPVHFVSSAKVEPYIPLNLWSYLLNFDGKDPTQFQQVPPEFQHQVRLIRLDTVQSQSTWAVGIKVEKLSIQQKEQCSLPPCYIVLTKNSQHFPRQTDAIMHASTIFVQQSRGAMLCS